ncbi:chemotaxis protein histidine kinase-like protein [Xenococcus sp. PCC 7305]|uniref:hybrid sensor histidine kinase/response regulator n=1 Tax=Xenococcus sp. PCC 7305 TaxID=102125 RepID=UPI0002ABAF50|nr:response regulator [Xenococcus sp. PCC 7305]ELS02994.1 chemotaxis protein histidine kinase-like protein [Xenococcus sp. PCC 7305]
MSFQLDPAVLASITQEARQCFLDEDAPEYLQTLIEGLQQQANSPDFTSLLRAAHSLKGGAGLAGIPSLQELAHKLEDVLKLLEQGEITSIDLGWDLVSQVIDETSFVLTQARTVPEVAVSPTLILDLDAFNQLNSQRVEPQDQPIHRQNQVNDLVIKTLNEDLETQLLEIDELDEDLPEEMILQVLASFYDECLFLSETLNVSWLAEIISVAQTLISEMSVAEALLGTKQIIPEIRNQRDLYLTNSTESADFELAIEQNEVQNNNFVVNALNEDLERQLLEIEELAEDFPEEIISQGLANFYDECLFLSETLNVSWLEETISIAQNLTSDMDAVGALEITKGIITEIREQRDLFLTSSTATGDLELATEQNEVQNHDFVINALNGELEAAFSVIEELSENLPEDAIVDFLADFHEKCLFLSETLDLPWIAAKISNLEEVLEIFPPFQVLFLAKEVISELRSQKARYLQELTGEEPKTPGDEFFPESDDADTPSAIFKFNQSDLANTRNKPKIQLRIPLQNIENMTNNVEELIIIESRLNLGQKQLQQAQKRLQKLNSQFEPIREQVQNFYNQLAINSEFGTVKAGRSFSSFSHSSNRFISSNPNREHKTHQTQAREFDSLELDRYTELHSSLQSFQELMLQIQETRRDIELINRNSFENLEQVKKNLGGLYENVTESRLVPFKALAKRFIPQIQSLNRRYNKSVVLEIQGEDTLIDQILLEQLQTPLTHLLNNAFDHGIESTEERIANGKSEIAHILLQAVIKNNQLDISLQDDGRGINLSKVHEKAINKGICDADLEFEQLSRKEMLTWIFQPDFSTADQVSEISGRGMGMDIVRSQILKLRGSLDIDTKLNFGTTFILKLPLNISLVSVLLVQLQNRMVAIPNSSIRETLLYGELPIIDHENPTLIWQEQVIPLASIASLLPCPREPLSVGKPKVGIILEGSFGHFAIAVDGLVSTENLIVKPFDDTIPIPPYLAGCTILGTGEVVPVILPQGFEISNLKAISAQPAAISSRQDENTVPTIMVAEDSVATRKLLEKILISVGCDVILCRDGQEAIEQFTLHYEKISVVISDVEMPRRNGFELLEAIKTHAEGQTIPVVMVTSRTGDRHRQKAEHLGANAYLGKPLQPQELLTTISSFIS